MKTYIIPATCDVCGGQGMTTAKTMTEIWTPGVSICHQDSKICAENLKQKKLRNIKKIT